MTTTNHIVFKNIVQYTLSPSKDTIFEIKDLSDFSNFLELSNKIHTEVLYPIKDIPKFHLYYALYSLVTNSYLDSQTKLSYFKEILYSPFNEFFIERNYLHNQFINYFCKFQKTYFTLLRFVKLCKIKYMKSCNDMDLLLTEIDVKSALPIVQNNRLYYFTKSDIIKLFYNSLTNTEYDLICKPIAIKNPYNHLAFSRINIYNMYFFVKERSYCYNPIIEIFFKENFLLKPFYNNNESFLVKHIIKRFLTNEPDSTIFTYVIQMIRYCNSNILVNKTKKLAFDKKFPKKIMVTVYRPYLYHYLLSRHTTDNAIQYVSSSIFKKKITAFVNNTPSFGRIICNAKKSCKNRYDYITKYYDYHKKKICKFEIDRNKSYSDYDFPYSFSDSDSDHNSDSDDDSDSDNDSDNAVIIANDNTNNETSRNLSQVFAPIFGQYSVINDDNQVYNQIDIQDFVENGVDNLDDETVMNLVQNLSRLDINAVSGSLFNYTDAINALPDPPIYNQPLSNWNVSNTTSMSEINRNTNNIEDININQTNPNNSISSDLEYTININQTDDDNDTIIDQDEYNN